MARRLTLMVQGGPTPGHPLVGTDLTSGPERHRLQLLGIQSVWGEVFSECQRH